MKKMFLIAFCVGGSFVVFGQEQKAPTVKAAFSSEIPVESAQIQYQSLTEPVKKSEKESSSTKLQPLTPVVTETKFRTREESETK